MIPAPVVMPIEVTDESIAIVVGSVLCRRRPVSPVMPFRVIEVVLPVGGTIVRAVTVEPPVGTVWAVKPEASVLISIEPGEAALLAAARVCVPVTSPEYVMVSVRVAVVAML